MYCVAEFVNVREQIERSSLLDKLRELTTLSVEQRLVAALQRMALYDGFLDRDGRVELCASRYRLLYELVGATRESVSLVLGRLSSEGLAERAGRTLLIAPTARLFKRLNGGSTGILLVHTLADANPRTTMRRVGLYSRPTPTRPDVARRRLYTLP